METFAVASFKALDRPGPKIIIANLSMVASRRSHVAIRVKSEELIGDGVEIDGVNARTGGEVVAFLSPSGGSWIGYP